MKLGLCVYVCVIYVSISISIHTIYIYTHTLYKVSEIVIVTFTLPVQ